MSYFIDLFEKKAAAYTNRIAIKTADESITYAELNKRANALAEKLQAEGVQAGDLVGIARHHSIDLIVAQLALWKIHAGFLMADLTQEGYEERLAHCNIKTVITDEKHKDEFENYSTITFDKNRSVKNPQRRMDTNNDLAYYICTSGTTGVGKTIRINHTRKDESGLVGCMISVAEELGINQDDTILCDTKQSFDPLIANLYAFLEGASLYMPSEEEFEDPQRLYENCEKHGANVHVILPTKIPGLKAYDENLKNIHQQKTLKFLPLGEKVTVDHIKQLDQYGTESKPVTKVIAYGNSECPIGQTATRFISGSTCVSIGKAMKGREIMIAKIDGKQATPVTPGERGILIYKSEGFGGYVNNPHATEALDLLVVDGDKQETGWRTTGDEVAYEVDALGNLVLDDAGIPIINIYGRSDMDMIKGPGATRLEVPTYAALVSEHPDVKDAHSIVVAKTPQLNEIITFVELDPEKHGTITTGQLHDFLKNTKKHNRLLTHKFVILNKDDSFINYTSVNQKKDHRQLKTAYIDKINPYSNENDLEQRLRQYWQEVLGFDISPLTSEECHFKALGGDSKSYLWLKVLLENDPLFGLQGVNVDVDIELPFRKNPTLDNLINLIKKNQNREKYIIRHYYERDTMPIFIIGDISTETLKTISDHQPIIQLRARDSVNVLEDYIKNIRYCQSRGPYFFLSQDTDLLSQLNNHFGSDVAFCNNLTTSNLTQKLHDQYQRSLQMRVETLLEKLQYKIVVNPHKAHIKDLDTAIKYHGFSDQMLNRLKYFPITVDYQDIESQSQLDKCRYSVQSKNHGLTITETITWTTYSATDFENQFNGQSIESTVTQWFEQQINRRFANFSNSFKAQLFNTVINYNHQLAQHMNAQGNCIQQKIPSLLSDKNAHSEPGAVLFDEHIIDHYHALYSSPLCREQTDKGIQLHYFNSALYNYFKAGKRPDNPYIFQKQADTEKKQQTCEKISTNFHADKGGKPLFLFPPMTGDNDYAKSIAGKITERPIVAFKHPKLCDVAVDDVSDLKNLARFYVEHLTALSPEGPYTLAGWSFGGLVANEVAQQLIDRGYEVDYLGIIDTPSPTLIAQQKIYNSDIFGWFAELHNLNDVNVVKEFLKNHHQTTYADYDKYQTAWNDFVSILDDYKDQQQHIALCLEVVTSAYRYARETSPRFLPQTHVYQATQSISAYPVIGIDGLGWSRNPDQCKKIEDSNHFTITQAPQFLRCIANDIEASYDAQLDDILQRHLNDHPSMNQPQTELHNPQTLTDNKESWLVLGQSGVGKTTLLSRIYHNYRDHYLKSPKTAPLPLLFKFNEHQNLHSLIESLGLTITQLNMLKKKECIFILDGMDEITIEAVEETFKYIKSLEIPNLKLIISCKDDYFDQHPRLQAALKYYLKPMKIEEQRLEPLRQEQVATIIDQLNDTLSAGDRDHIQKTIMRSVDKSQLTPLYIRKFAKAFKDAEQQIPYQMGHYTMATLQRITLAAQAQAYKLSTECIQNFGMQLAITKLNLNPPFSSDDQRWLQRLTENERTDTKTILNAMNIKHTPQGFDFYHRSDYLYYLALALFNAALDSNSDFAHLLNQFSIAENFELLDLIADIYDDYVFLASQDHGIK